MKERKTRSEKRKEKHRREQLQVNPEEEREVQELEEDNYDQHELEISVKTLQAIDITLQSARDAVKTCEAEQGTGFFTRDEQLVLPALHY